MSEQETMRLVAELLDKTGGPLAQMQKNIKATSDVASSLHKSGSAQAREHAKAYRELQESIRKIKDQAIDVVRPGLDSLGLTSLSVAGAIAAVTSAVKGLGDAGQILTFTARNSGATIGMIRALGDAGMRFGVSQDAMNAGLSKFGAFMDQNARRAPDALNAWNQMPGAWQRLGRSLVGLNRDAQINRVLDFIPSVKYIDQRRKLLSILGLPEDWANLTRAESEKVREAAKRFNELHPFAMENAAKSKEAWDAISSSMRGIRDDMGAAFGPDVVRGVEVVQKFLDDKGNIEAFKTGLGDEISKIRETIKATREELETFKNIYNWFKDHTIFSDKYPKGDDPMGKDYTRKTAPVNKMLNDLREGWSPKASEDATAKGTKQGLEDFYNSLTKQSAGGYTPMAYHPDGGGGGRGFRSSDGYSVMPDGGDNSATSGSVPKGMGGPRAGGGQVGGSFDRARFAEELRQKPWLKEKLFHIGAGENRDPLANQMVMESAMNRAAVRRTSLEAQLRRHAQSGKDEGGYYAGYSVFNAKQRAMMEDNLAKVLGGSNESDYATDNSSGSLAERERASGSFRFHRYQKGESFFSPGSREPVLRDRYRAMRDAAEHDARAGGSKSVFDTGAPPVRDLLENGKRSGLMGGSDGGLNGSASLTIDLNGFPRGTRTASSFDGLFKQVTLNRGRPMSPASETA